jgi:hypothetical protein
MGRLKEQFKVSIDLERDVCPTQQLAYLAVIERRLSFQIENKAGLSARHEVVAGAQLR